MLEHDGDGARRFAGFAAQADGDAAEGRDRHVERHAHAAHRAAQHHALAMQVDDAQPLVGRFVGGGKPHGQREGVEPRRGLPARPDPAANLPASI